MPEVEIHVARGKSALARLAAGAAVLDALEQQRAARFRFEDDRLMYRAAHVLLRRVLSRQLPLAPEQWRFRLGRHGRPEIDTDRSPAAAGLHFNLTHTRGLVACALARDVSIGVDAECHRRICDRRALAERFFAPAEAAAVATAGPEGSSAEAITFYGLWTLKESYVKALGLGLSLGLDRFAFRLGNGRPRRIELGVDADAPYPAEAWRCLLLRLDGGDCSLAAALAAGGSVQFQVWLHAADGRPPAMALDAMTEDADLLPVLVDEIPIPDIPGAEDQGASAV